MAAVGDVVVHQDGGIPLCFRGLPKVTLVSEGVRMARKGATVHILPGKYCESVVVGVDVSLIGYGFVPNGEVGVDISDLAAVIQGSDAGPALTIQSAVTVRGLRLENASEDVNAVEVTGGSGWILEGCSIHGMSIRHMDRCGGIVVRGGLGMVRSCTVNECGWNGIVVSGSSHVTLERCKVVRSKWSGVCVDEEATVRMVDCWCMDNDMSGLSTHAKSDVVVKCCKIVRNKMYGVQTSAQSHVHLVDSVCDGNRHSGIVSRNSSQCAAERCRLVNNGDYGARQLEPSSLSLVECELGGNGLGDQ
jgi:hypothetical protein